MSWLRAFAGDLYQAIFRPGKRYTPTRTWRKDETWLQLHDRLRDWTRIEQERHRVHRKQSSTVKVSRVAMVTIGGLRCGQTHQGRKRFLTVDSLGCLASFGHHSECWRTRGWQTSAQASQKMGKSVSRLHTIWVDAGFDGEPFMQWVMDVCRWIVQVVHARSKRKGSCCSTVGGRAHFGG